ncbi:hypothetical protein, partial [Cetobacterium sp.]|uniref:hypothetical protein n=1 Tax=Cetobacterium sp. TaxID=2071632 RepID=UPI003F3C96E9
MIKHIVFSILMFICSLSIYSDVPNEVITKNPKKEVTTINSEKNRDYANMSITVNKINIIDIKGKKLKDGIVFSILKKDKDLLSNKEYIAVELLPQLQKFNKSIKKDLENEIPILLKEDEIKKTFKSLKFKDSKEFYVLEINKKNNRINKVYKILSESKEEIGMVYNTIYAPLYAKKGQILDYISEDIELENIPFSQTRTLSTESKITFNDEYISNKTGVNLDIGAMYFGQFWYNFFNDILPSINLVNMDKAQNLSKPSNYTRIGDSIIANYFKEAHIVSFYKALSMKDGIYFEPTSNQILGTYKVSGTFSKDGTIFRRAEAKIEVTRNPEKTQITLSPIAPLNTELKTREQNNYLDIVNLKEDLSYVTKQNKNRITLRAEDNSKVTDVSTTTTRAIKLEKDGCIIKVEYKQVNGETAKPIITKLKEANAQQTFNIKVGMLAEDMRTYLNGEDTLIINVEPKSTIDIGEVVFNIDKRINSLSESWIKADGSVSQGVDRLQDNYSALVNVTNNFNNLTSTNISDVMKINNRNISEIRTSYDSTRYKIFLKAAGNYKDESAMPLNINLNDLKSRLMISKNNEGTTDEALNNRFILKGENN